MSISTFGKVLKRVRIHRGLTQKELAESIKITVTYVSLLENDNRNPSLGLVLRLFKTLEFSPVLAFYLMDTGSVDRELGEKLAYGVYLQLDNGNDSG